MSSTGDVNAFSRISQAFSDKFLGGKKSRSHWCPNPACLYLHGGIPSPFPSAETVKSL
jgi:hypothetical protein